MVPVKIKNIILIFSRFAERITAMATTRRGRKKAGGAPPLQTPPTQLGGLRPPRHCIGKPIQFKTDFASVLGECLAVLQCLGRVLGGSWPLLGSPGAAQGRLESVLGTSWRRLGSQSPNRARGIYFWSRFSIRFWKGLGTSWVPLGSSWRVFLLPLGRLRRVFRKNM